MWNSIAQYAAVKPESWWLIDKKSDKKRNIKQITLAVQNYDFMKKPSH